MQREQIVLFGIVVGVALAYYVVGRVLSLRTSKLLQLVAGTLPIAAAVGMVISIVRLGLTDWTAVSILLVMFAVFAYEVRYGDLRHKKSA